MHSLLRRGAVAVASSALALGALPGPATADSGRVPLADAGAVTGWGSSPVLSTIPASLSGKAVTAVAAGGGFNFALTADGKVTAWGDGIGDAARNNVKVPAGLSDVIAVEAGLNGVALRSNGTVVAWGDPGWGITNVPAGLRDVTKVSAPSWTALALKKDGTVVTWGRKSTGAFAVPAGLSNVVDVAASEGLQLALKSDGTVVGWGEESSCGCARLPVPAEIQGRTIAIANGAGVSGAITDDHRVHLWRGTPSSDALVNAAVETVLGGEKAVSISIPNANRFSVLTESGKVFVFDASGGLLKLLEDHRYTQASTSESTTLGLYAALRTATPPRVSGTATTGHSLSLSSGTFSGAPETVTSQWKADGTPITGATGTTLALTSAHLGKRITVTQTATKGGETVSATSAATAPVALPQVASTVRASAAAVRYGASAPRVNVLISPAGASGRVDVSKGTRRLATGTAQSGRASLTLPKTALTPGVHTLTIRYAGSATVKASATSVRISVAKANAKVSAKAATKKIVAKKTRAKVKVSVRATGVRANGTVAVFLGAKKVGTARLKANGTAVVRLKKLPKAGKVKLSVRYLGSATVNKSAKTIKVKVRKA
ncbi:RCC1 domain-containing protein [Mumia quercus]|uniref:RCC1 domain-containing protein n=1 Tax=Mumia quercus TaxID=2976125 RepID=UPI0021D2073A|nr:Ig-like domain repeat protein [Mumia quercus]